MRSKVFPFHHMISITIHSLSLSGFILLYLKRGDECVNEYGAPVTWKKTAEKETVE